MYVVVDVYSRLMSAFYVELENLSYVTAMLALANAMVDKFPLCQSLGYDIEPERLAVDWAERGELLDHQVEYLDQALL